MGDDDISFSFKSSHLNHFWGRTPSFYKQTHDEGGVVGDTWVFVSENHYESIEEEVMIDDNDNYCTEIDKDNFYNPTDIHKSKYFDQSLIFFSIPGCSG